MKKPIDIKKPLGYIAAQAYAMIIEHNVTNVFRTNFHRISENMFRSSQPTTYQLKNRIKRYGLKTVVNLRGYERNSPMQALEEEVCRSMGVKLVYIEVYSRKIPELKTLLQIKETLENIEYPAMLHCKSGADRAGLVSTLYMHWIKGVELQKAGQLKLWPFGHIRHARTGLIDFFFDNYLKDGEKEGLTLLQWAENRMDRERLEKEFRPIPFFEKLVDKVLRRE